MPRIIGGKQKDVKIKFVKRGTRPILARVKKSLFSSIEIKGRSFLDLYAGSGSCGIEALSRNASFCVFVERDREKTKKIREALKMLDFKNAYVLPSNVFSLKLKEKFDIIFLGPPYSDCLVNKTISFIEKKHLLAENGIIIAQHHKKENVDDVIGSYFLEKQKSFGETMLSFYKYENSDFG